MSLGRDAIFEPLYDRFPKQYGLSIHLEIQSIIFEGIAKHVTACINGNYLWKSFGYREVPLELQHGIRRDISALKNWFRSNESKRLESRLITEFLAVMLALVIKERLLCADDLFEVEREWSFRTYLFIYNPDLFKRHFDGITTTRDYLNADVADWGRELRRQLQSYLVLLPDKDERLAITRGCLVFLDTIAPIVECTKSLNRTSPSS